MMLGKDVGIVKVFEATFQTPPASHRQCIRIWSSKRHIEGPTSTKGLALVPPVLTAASNDYFHLEANLIKRCSHTP
ncbi:hypothetical protein SAMN04489740_4244 [Arthrobacter alpinus]|uniref:Uncharacterized protein n=1 Tax=Arthrobacter alpinus TaxID=656366 RepID=A0A1H5PFG2_9MICC|nr:hypothetical protein SAMN04489740_4244 [Arthrobacter alpinus]